MRKIFFLICCLFFDFIANSQIIINNAPPYNTPNYLVDNVLLGGGITATNHTFLGDPNQIGF